MKNLLLILLVASIFSANAQQAVLEKECITTKVTRIDKLRVKVITHDKCKNVKVVKIYSKKKWDKIVADGKRWRERRKTAPKRRKGILRDTL
jgi:hypothetical protein